MAHSIKITSAHRFGIMGRFFAWSIMEKTASDIICNNDGKFVAHSDTFYSTEEEANEAAIDHITKKLI